MFFFAPFFCSKSGLVKDCILSRIGGCLIAPFGKRRSRMNVVMQAAIA